jgi:hypothetical protein
MGGSNAGYELLDRVVTYVVDPAVKVIFTLGLFFFLWGFIEFLWAMKDGKVDENGKNHMIWGVAGMVIMVSVYGIISLIMNTLGIDFNTATDVSRIQQVNPNSAFYGR